MMRGFSLIELMLALAIGSILSGIMYMCLFQSQRVADSIENITTIQMRVLIARRQLVRDISGAFVPPRILEPKKVAKKDETDKESAAKTQQHASAQEAQVKPEDQKLSPEEQIAAAKKALAQAFNGTADDKQFKQLKFITNNPLEIFWSNKAGRPKFRAENVAYSLEQEQSRGEPSFKLMRSTAYPKGEKDTEGTSTYELIGGIKSMSVSYLAIIEEQESENKQEDSTQVQSGALEPSAAQEKKPPQKELKTFSDWAVAGMEDNDVRLQKKLPSFVKITLELWAPAKTKSDTFMFTVPIAWQEIKQKPKQTQQPKQQLQKAIPGAMPGVPTAQAGNRGLQGRMQTQVRR